MLNFLNKLDLRNLLYLQKEDVRPIEAQREIGNQLVRKIILEKLQTKLEGESRRSRAPEIDVEWEMDKVP